MEKRYHTLLFDLDGTLIHSKPGIEECFYYALTCMENAGRPIRYPEGFYIDSIIGPPLTHSFRRFVETEDDVVLAVKFYREKYLTTGWTNSKPFAGVADAIKRLADAGRQLLVATSKMEELARDTLIHHGLARCFDVIAGASEDDARSSKWDVIERALTLSGAPREGCVMIGDRMHDMEGAQQAGLDAIGVLWGYGSREELGVYRPVLLAQTPDELAAFLQ